MRIEHLSDVQALLPKTVIPRDLFWRVLDQTDAPEIQIIYGPKQVGKSTLMYALMERLFDRGTDMFYFNLDMPQEVFSSPELFLSDIASKKQTSGRTFVFVDEIQRKPDVGPFLKYIYDWKKSIKFITTGSSSLAIQQQIRESLTGRKFEYTLSSCSLGEIFSWQGIDVKKASRITPDMAAAIDAYLLYGGYPGVLLLPAARDKIGKLREIADSYVTRDLVELFSIRSAADLTNCAVYLAQTIGSLVSRENIAKTLSLSVHSVNTYIEALEQTFLIALLPPFFRNPKLELSHRPKVYFLDNGIRNALLHLTSPALIAAQIGPLFEQTVFQTIHVQRNDTVRFWRTTNQTEVDFIVSSAEGLHVYEAKYDWGKPHNTTRNIRSFEQRYGNDIRTSAIIDRTTIIDLIR